MFTARYELGRLRFVFKGLNHTTPFHSIYLLSILISLFYSYLGLPVCLFPSRFPTKTQHTISFPLPPHTHIISTALWNINFNLKILFYFNTRTAHSVLFVIEPTKAQL